MAYGPPTAPDPTNVMGRRIAAWFIDIVIPAVIALAVGWSIFVGSAQKSPAPTTGYCSTIRFEQPGASCVQLGNNVWVATSGEAHHALAVGGLVYLIGAVNLFVVQGLTGATVGKHIFGLRVVREDGGLVPFGWNALRTLLLVVDQFFCALPGIITAGVTHPHRRIGDFAAGTYVVGKQSVGTPIGAGLAASPYPPPWTPPGAPVGWGPPAAGAPPGNIPATSWGSPPPASAPTQAWGSPAAQPPPAQAPAAWGSPAPVPDDPPAGVPAPQAVAQPVRQPAPQPAQAPPSREPQWDAQRNAWVYWEAETSRWLQHDPTTGQWGPLR